jgi:glutathione-regulated potassium-efflux system ancillary protein KefC
VGVLLYHSSLRWLALLSPWVWLNKDDCEYSNACYWPYSSGVLMEFIWILFAFICGLGVKLMGFPSLIGFLLAGFVLNALGFSPDDKLQSLADIGITLMLFTIGLKLNVRDLLKPEVGVSAGLHMILWTSLLSAFLLGASWFGFSHFLALEAQTSAILAFALSFSSTVCVVKILEDSGEIKTRHGQLAIGILIIQDILAVLFIVVATGQTPSIYALSLLLLPFVAPLLTRLLNLSGHGELLPLTGFLLALGGYQLFDFLGVKGDLGALMAGILLANHAKANELAKSLMSFKDVFLIGFFLSVGLTALPDWSMLLSALALCLMLPLKFILFFTTMTALRLRARTAYLGSLVLSNFSEFGLIVVALAVGLNWLEKEWLIIVALAVSFSFIATSLFYASAHNDYQRWKKKLSFFERKQRLAEDIYLQPANARVLVLGMGRVGKGAYTALRNILKEEVWGMDADPIRVKRQTKMGMQVMLGDGEDAELWDNLDLSSVHLILLALPSIDDISHVSEQLRHAHYQGKIAAIARYEDQVQALLDTGTDKVFNFFTEAGVGFAEESLHLLNGKNQQDTA